MSEPSRIVVLTESELEAVIERAVLKALNSNGASHNNGEDRRLTSPEAAAMLNVSVRWLYRHSKALPFTKRMSRKCLRFSEAGLLRYLAAKKN